MRAGDRGVHRRDLAAGHVLGLVDGLLDRRDRRVDVDDVAAPQPLRRRGADADDVDAVLGHLARDAGDLRGADVESDDDLGGLGLRHEALLILFSGCKCDGDVIGADVEVDRACARALVVGERGPRGVERVHARGEVASSSAPSSIVVALGAQRERAVRVEWTSSTAGRVARAPRRERGHRVHARASRSPRDRRGTRCDRAR